MENSVNLITSGAVYTALQNATIQDALIFKGVVNSNNDLPTNHTRGWVYKVAVAGTYVGETCEVGDTIYCITSGTSANNADWAIVQTNIDGYVIGPASSTANNIATYTGATGKVIQDSGYSIDDLKFKVLSYGHSTWQEFLEVFNTNRVVYCRASSNANPATGNQTRLAFMAFVNYSSGEPNSVEFQYYRSVNTHSITQQGDQVFIYKLSKNSTTGTWSVTTREASSKIVAGTGLSSSYSNDTLTLNNTVTNTTYEFTGGTNSFAISASDGTTATINITPYIHTLTFGANNEFSFDGSADVNVPVYTGAASWGQE